MPTLVEKLGKLVAQTRGRYMNPDPAQAIELGSFGRIENGAFRKLGRIDRWFKAVGVDGISLDREPSNITESSTLASVGVRETTFNLGATVGVEPAGVPLGNAKIGFEINFTGENQFYFHVPGLRFVGIKDIWILGAKLVELAKLDRHEKRFWEDDYCVVTGVYEVQSMLRILSERAGEKVAFTAAGATTVDDMYKIGADFGFVSKNDISCVLRESYKAPGGQCVAFYEMHKVHWDIFGNKWWKSV